MNKEQGRKYRLTLPNLHIRFMLKRPRLTVIALAHRGMSELPQTVDLVAYGKVHILSYDVIYAARRV